MDERSSIVAEGAALCETITLLPGHPEAQQAVIAFAGVQAMLGGIAFSEFAKTLSPNEGTAGEIARPVAFVREIPSRWYNTFDPALLEPFLRAHDDRAVVTLGNSMGGFAAILFSLVLPHVRRSIAFCPQFSVHPDHCPWESRWREFVTAIDSWRFETCLAAPPDRGGVRPDHVLFCGSDVAADIRHAEAILANAGTPAATFLIHGCGHDVARHLKLRGLLVPLFDQLIDDLAPVDAIADHLRQQDVSFDMLQNAPSASTAAL